MITDPQILGARQGDHDGLLLTNMIDRQAMNFRIPAIEQPKPTADQCRAALRTLARVAARQDVGARELLDAARMLDILPEAETGH